MRVRYSGREGGHNMFSYFDNIDLSRNTDDIVTGVNASAYHGLCPSNPSVVELVNFEGDSPRYLPFGLYVLINNGEVEEVYEENGLKYVGKFRALEDLIISFSDDSAIEESLDTLKYEGNLDDFMEYVQARNPDLIETFRHLMPD